MNNFWTDLRWAVRVLARNRGLTIASVLTLALGVGANTAIFTAVNGVLLRPLPYPDADRLLQVWQSDEAGHGPISPLNYRDWAEQNRTLEVMALYGYENAILTGVGNAQRVNGSEVTSSLFRVLGVQPMLGRVFGTEDDRPGTRTLVLSHGFWQQQFGGDPGVLGRSVVLNSENYTIIGVMPAGFAFPNASVSVWFPLGIDFAAVERGSRYLFGLARLRPDAALAAAREDLSAISRRLEERYPETNKGSGVALVPLRDELVGDARTALLVLLAAVGIVLLIACANVANLLLTRAAGRRAEVAVRRALGAGTWRLARLFLTEALLLAILGSGAGVLLAVWGVDALLVLGRGLLPSSLEIRVDRIVFVFSLGVLMLVTIVLGLTQAFALARAGSAGALREGGRDASPTRARQRLRGGLAIAQLGLALPLLAGAGLLLQTVYRLQRVSAGFHPQSVFTAQVSLPNARYPEPERQADFVARALEGIQTLPGVAAAGATNDLPFAGSRSLSSYAVEGREDENTPHADYRLVSPDYLRAMGVPLLQGRFFDAADDTRSRKVILINETLSRREFPGEQAIGKRLLIGDGEPREIVGIVGDIKHDDLRAEASPEMYLPLAQQPSTRLFFAVRTTGDPVALTAGVTAAVNAVDPEQPVWAIRTMEDRVASSFAAQRAIVVLLGAFAGVAVLLAVIGLYAVIAYGTAQRTRELGIRVALGARPADIFRLVLSQGAALVGLGLTVGLAAALALTRVLGGLLFGVQPADPLTLTAVASLLAIVALIGCWLPARRATRSDPMTVLRLD